MKRIHHQQLKAEVDTHAQKNLWLIAQQRWSLQLAHKVLEREAAFKSKDKTYQANHMELGLVFLEDVDEFDFQRIQDFERLFFFNQNIQFQFVRYEDDPDYFLMSIHSDDCQDQETIWPLQINDRIREFRFGALLGSIPNARIGVKTCAKHQTWRFHHE